MYLDLRWTKARTRDQSLPTCSVLYTILWSFGTQRWINLLLSTKTPEFKLAHTSLLRMEKQLLCNSRSKRLAGRHQPLMQTQPAPVKFNLGPRKPTNSNHTSTSAWPRSHSCHTTRTRYALSYPSPPSSCPTRTRRRSWSVTVQPSTDANLKQLTRSTSTFPISMSKQLMAASLPGESSGPTNTRQCHEWKAGTSARSWPRCEWGQNLKNFEGSSNESSNRGNSPAIVWCTPNSERFHCDEPQDW